MQKKARGARGGGGMVRGKGAEGCSGARRLPISPGLPTPLFFPAAHRAPPMRFSNKVENTDRQCSKSYGGVYYIWPARRFRRCESTRHDASPRLVSSRLASPRLALPRHATPIIISLERAASLRRLYRNGVDVCFVCTSPSGVLQRVGISKQEVGTFVITQARVPARRETSQSHRKVIGQFPFIPKDRHSVEDRLSIAQRFG